MKLNFEKQDFSFEVWTKSILLCFYTHNLVEGLMKHNGL